LYIACADIDEQTFQDWHVRYLKASTDIQEQQARNMGLPNQIEALAEEMEHSFELLGSTAIEDTLQDGVPDTVKRILQAGIKLWVLTGDKQETAINIGYSCNLLTSSAQLTIIDEQDCKNSAALIKAKLLQAIHSLSSADQDPCHNALVIDGPSLLVLCDHGMQALLLRVADECQAVITCRVSPAQKAQIVKMVKDAKPGIQTLAIGDGANGMFSTLLLVARRRSADLVAV
jgi:magnesium-transporting ATPase (P-type)